MTEVATEAAGPQASYELTYELDGSSYAVRENLVDIFQRELLGPIRGPEETLPFSPRSQYLVGHIAPVKLVGSATATPDDTDGGDLVEVRADDDGMIEGRVGRRLRPPRDPALPVGSDRRSAAAAAGPVGEGRRLRRPGS